MNKAAKRRKNAAHGVSRGSEKLYKRKPRKGRKNTHDADFGTGTPFSLHTSSTVLGAPHDSAILIALIMRGAYSRYTTSAHPSTSMQAGHR